MMKRTVVLVACLATLSACSNEGGNGASETSSEPKLALADACAEVAAMDNSLRTEDSEYAEAVRAMDALIERSEPSAVAALTTVRDAYATQLSAAPGEEKVNALSQEISAFEKLAENCQAVGSPLE